ncbi:MAG: glutamine synthetase [Chloroflexi bacterium]|nr:glutamine synthetase [Chloroflexota bacterium]
MNRELAATQLGEGAIELLRVLWCDNSNVIRTKSIYLPSYLDRLSREDHPHSILDHLEDSVSITAALQAVPGTRDEPAPLTGLAPVEDIRLLPAWDTFALSASCEQIATVSANMFEGESAWVHCPRHFLLRMQQQLAEHSLAVEMGAELEFYLLRPAQHASEMPTPVDDSPFASAMAAHKSHKVIGDILRSLRVVGVPVEQYLPESGPGQQEITLEHCPPIHLADRLIRAREAIRAVANDHGLIASFLPAVFEESTGSGMHVHVSLWQNGRNIMSEPGRTWGISATAKAFMAGILKHLPALMSATTPTVNSYRRIRPHVWSGAYQAWGIANKEAAIRVLTHSISGTATNFEIKTVDASANPYVALGCIIAAGLDGLRNQDQLPEPVEIDPGNYTPEERERRGIQPLPTTLPASLDRFEIDQALRAAMDPAFADVFAAVRRFELETMSELTFEEERLFLLERY